ncbi:hypothetical protein MY11210_006666 [Beauveria gryllotalpidicola]
MGVLNVPNGLDDLPALAQFGGQCFHTSKWRDIDFEGKRVMVIGNGCSANQVIPWIMNMQNPKSVVQLARSAQWVAPKDNHPVSALQRACLKYIPLAILIPKYEFGAKRPVMDHGYLEITNNPKFQLVRCDGIVAVEGTGKKTIVDGAGNHHEVDVIILANGFKTQDLLVPMEVRGQQGRNLREEWKDRGGAEAYMGVSVHGFPNLFMLAGPNTLPSGNSTLHGIECSVVYIIRVLRGIREKSGGINNGRNNRDAGMAVMPTQEAEAKFNVSIQEGLKSLVYTKHVRSWPEKMKRKIEDMADTAEKTTPTLDESDKSFSFADLALDPRLVQAVAEHKFSQPTLVQRMAIPIALKGQDVLCKAKTGSGKTAAYVLPVLAGILKRKTTDPEPATAALILVPTRELADQVFKAIEQFSAFCSKDVRAVKLTDKLSDAVQRSLLATLPDIVISTPARAWHNVNGNSSALSLGKLSHLVLDEADLLLSYGYDSDLENLSWSIPKGIQTIMMSATLTSEVDSLKKIFYRDNVPELLDLEEPENEGEGITQLVTKCGEDEKFLLAYVIFKLKLVKGKCIIFVGDIDRCYRLKLFFEQFGIRSCILNAELPVNSRIHVVEEFNKNVYDIIIASDENEILGNEDKAGEEEAEEAEDQEGEEETDKSEKRPKKKRKATKQDLEYGVSRGIDFKNVAAVINFDLPTTASSYTHRIGRTARAGKAGMALSFVVPKDQYRKHMPTTIASAEKDEKIMARITKQQAKKGKEIKPYNFNPEQVEAFRYRMNDALRAVTKVAVREARTRELRQELLKSEKLKRYFEENPTEMAHLRHDGELRTARQQAHLKHVPEYLLPKEGKEALTAAKIGFVPLRKFGGKDRKSRRGKSGKRIGSRKGDPLKTFTARRRK